MARMMDSLILDNFPPFAFTKITTTHRQARNPSMNFKRAAAAAAAASAAGGGGSTPNVHQTGNLNGGIRINLQKTAKIPTQGKHFKISLC